MIDTAWANGVHWHELSSKTGSCKDGRSSHPTVSPTAASDAVDASNTDEMRGCDSKSTNGTIAWDKVDRAGRLLKVRMAEQTPDKLSGGASGGANPSVPMSGQQAMESKGTPASFTFKSSKFLSAPLAWDTVGGVKQDVSGATTGATTSRPQQTFTFEFPASRSRSPSFTFTPPASEKVRSASVQQASTPEKSLTPTQSPRSIDQYMEALKIGEPFNVLHKCSSSESWHIYGDAPNNVRRDPGLEHESTTRLATDDSTVKGTQNPDLEHKILNPHSRESDKFLGPPAAGRDRRTTSARQRRRSSQAPVYEHNVADEAPPDDAFHDTRFQKAFSDARQLVERLVATLQNCLTHQHADQNIRSICDQAVELSRREKGPSRVVGLVGDSGVGKSSLINSLLNIQGLARADNGGEACTCVATEYHYHASQKFIAEIEYFTESELSAQFSELLQAYRVCNNALTQNNEHELQDDESEALKETAKIAEYTFSAAFRDRIEPVQELLKEPHDEVLQKLLEWTRDQGVPLGDGRRPSLMRTTFDDQMECTHQLAELTSEDTSAKRRSKWPFIKKVRIFSNAHVLSKGLILADLPGLHDLNSARVKVTENYLKECDEILVVCQIGRAKTSAGVKEVFNLAKRARLRGHIGIVCTKSDDINEDEAARGLQGLLANEVQNLRKKLQDIDIEMKEQDDFLRGNTELVNEAQYDPELDETSKEELLRDLREDKEKLLKEKTETEKTQAGLKKKLAVCLNEARNLNVEKGLQKQYQSPPNNAPAQVFCVSNTTYREHRTKSKEDCQHYLELSGILRLRRYCLSVVSNGQYQFATQYMHDEIPALLSRLDLWAQRGAADLEKTQALREVVDEVVRELSSIVNPKSQINAIARQMDDQFRQLILHDMENYSNKWAANAAKVAHKEFGEYKPSTYKAFCRRFGDHSTPKSNGRHIWNDEAMSSMFVDMNGHWNPAVRQLRHFFGSIAFFTKECFDRAIVSAETENATQTRLTKLPTILKTQKQLLINHLNRLFEQCENDIRVIWSNAFSGLRTSFIGELMENTYVECNLDKGAGSDKRRKDKIENAFGSPELLTAHRYKLSQAFSTLARDLQTRIYEEASFRIGIITKDVDLFRLDPVAMDSKEARESRRKVQEAVSAARRQLDALRRSWQPIELPANELCGHELDAQKESSIVSVTELASTTQLRG